MNDHNQTETEKFKEFVRRKFALQDQAINQIYKLLEDLKDIAENAQKPLDKPKKGN